MRPWLRLGDHAIRAIRYPLMPGTVIVVIASGIVALGLLLHGYRRDVTALETRSEFLVRILEEQTLRQFQLAHVVVQGMAATVGRASLPEHDPAFEQSLRTRMGSLPYVRALYVIGPDGFITQDTDHPKTPRVSLADRGYFKAHQADPSLELFIGPPLVSRSVNRWFVSLSVPVRTIGEGFGGIAVAAIEPSFYETFYSELGLGPGDTISLTHSDGTLIAGHPWNGDIIGTKVSGLGLPVQAAAPPGPGGPMQPSRRIESSRAIPDMPLTVSVSLDKAALIAKWRMYSAAVSLVYLFCSGSAVTAAYLMNDRRRIRREMRQRTKVAQKLEALGQMTGGIAHDFKNLIAAADAGLRLATRHADDGERVRQSLAMADEALRRGSKLASQLLAFARRQELEVVAADANEILRELEPLLRHAAGPHVHLACHYADRLPPCSLDQAQFDSALMNLVVNARDAMPDGGTIRIRTEIRDEGTNRASHADPARYVRVVIEDSGPGMPPDVLSRAFEPFFSTKGEKGTGLGLAQVYGFMQQIGGDVRVRSGMDTGTTFDLLFRVAPHREEGPPGQYDPRPTGLTVPDSRE